MRKTEVGKGLIVALVVVFFLGMVSANSVSIVPSTSAVLTGESVVVDVEVSTTTSDIHSIQFDIFYDGVILDYYSIVEGDFLSEGGSVVTIFGNGSLGSGVISGIYNARNVTSGITTTGTIATITFNASAVGSSQIGLHNVIWVNSTILNASAEVITPTITNGTVNVASAPCTMDSAFWSATDVVEGTVVTLTVQGTNCDGEEVVFEVFEDDSGILEFPFGGADDPVSVNPVNAFFSGGSVITTWTTEWQNDCGGICNPPEYYFNAELVSDSGINIQSASDLNVQKLINANALFVSPATQNVNTGDTFLVEVRAQAPVTASDIYGVQFDFSYDNALLTFNSIVEGGMLSQSGVDEVIFNYTAIPGLVDDIIVLRNETNGSSEVGIYSDEGVVVVLNFSATSSGTSSLDLFNVTWVNSTITNFSVGVAGVSVTNGSVVVSDPANQAPIINDIDCLIDSVWEEDCSAFDYGETLEQIRAECVDSDGSVLSVGYVLRNIEDATTFIDETENSGVLDVYTHDVNPDLTLADSGTMELTITCTDDDSDADSNITTWSIPWGNLSASLVNPISDSNVTQYEFFPFTSSVTCTGGECGDVAATLDPIFGYVTEGSSQDAIPATECRVVLDSSEFFTASAGDVIREIHTWARSYISGTKTFDVSLYTVLGGVPQNLVFTETLSFTDTGSTTVPVSVTGLNYPLVAGQTYTFAVSNGVNTPRVSYNDVTDGIERSVSGCLDPWSGTVESNTVYTVYFVYDSGGGGGSDIDDSGWRVLYNESFDGTHTAVDGETYGTSGWLTFQLLNGGEITINNGYAFVNTSEWWKAALVRSTNTLPENYKIRSKVGYIDYEWESYSGEPLTWNGIDFYNQNENGIYLLTITNETCVGTIGDPAYCSELWWHYHRKIVIDTDDHQGEVNHPLYMVWMDPAFAPWPNGGNALHTWSGGQWTPINEWNVARIYDNDTYYIAEFEKNGTQAILRLYDENETLLEETDPVDWSGVAYNADPDWLYVGEPHGDDYKGNARIDDIVLLVPDTSTKGAVSTIIGDTPFYTTDANPNATGCFVGMNDGDSCETTWQVNATGGIDETYEFFTIYDAVQYSGVGDDETARVNLTITASGPVCVDEDGDGYNVTGGGCGAIDCDDTPVSGVGINPGVVESGVSMCTDTIDNDCDGDTDYDSSDGNHGDDGCGVDITGASPSGGYSHVAGGTFGVACFVSVSAAQLNSVYATIDASSCAFDSYAGGLYAFTCDAGVFTGSNKTVTCTINTSRSYSSVSSMSFEVEVYEGCTDFDGDRYAGEADPLTCGNDCGGQACLGGNDCNDNNDTIWQELTGYPDNDTDTFYSEVSEPVCSGTSLPTSYSTTQGTDCNDDNANVNPGEAEMCDLLDNDCNAGTSDGVNEPTYGDPTSCGIGVCAAAGIMDCVAGSMVDTCSPGPPLSSDDTTCDNVDDDCSGTVDEDYIPDNSCFLPGACTAGNTPSSCVGGSVIPCSPGSPSGTPETVCNGVDDDCDSSTDEDYVNDTSCFLPGVCAAGNVASRCIGGSEFVCQTGSPTGTDDDCNGLDEDCNGAADDGYIPSVTNCGVGVCAATGLLNCVAGSPVDTCVPGSPTETPESSCGDGLDNDCDSLPDCSDPTDCSGIDPICTGCFDNDGDGYDTCNPGDAGDDGLPADCNDVVGLGENINPGELDVCNGVDDDCNAGTVDGVNHSGYGNVTSCGVGECAAAGVWTCSSGAIIDNCSAGAPTGPDNDCNGLDENCDGIPDDGYVSDASCGVGVCQSGNTPSSCVGGSEILCVPGLPTETPEATCDDLLDNDCDGDIDMGDSDCLTSFCTDDDVDTYDNCTLVQGGDANDAVDCDNSDASVYPGAPENCTDGIDNQCFGDVGFGDVDCADASCSAHPSCIPGACGIDDMYWNTTLVEEDTLVGLVVEGTDCDGVEISFTIFDDDGLLDPDDLVIQNPVNATFSSGTAVTTWVAEWQDDAFLGIDTNPEYYFVVRVDSTDYSSSSYSGLLTVNLTTRKWEERNITLNPGRNSFSLPLFLNNYSIGDVFSGLNSDIDWIYTYDGGFEIYHFTGLPSNLNDLEVGKGYILFVNSPTPVVLTINGSKRDENLERPTINLAPGWNFMGTFSSSYEAQSILSGITYNELYTYNQSAGAYQLVNPSDYLDDEQGYWIYVNESGNFVPITGRVSADD